MQARRLVASTALVLAALFTAGTTTACEIPSPSPPSPTTDTYAELWFTIQVNELREFFGVPPLWSHGNLVDKGRGWSQHMANGGCWPSSICHSRLSDGIWVPWAKLGENVGVGPNLDSLFLAFAQSYGHAMNMLSPEWFYFGIGVIRQGGRYWVSMEFLRPA